MPLPVAPQFVLKGASPAEQAYAAGDRRQPDTRGIDGVLQLKVSCTTSSALISELKESHREHSLNRPPHRASTWAD